MIKGLRWEIDGLKFRHTCYEGDLPAELSHRGRRCRGHSDDEDEMAAAVAEKGGEMTMHAATRLHNITSGERIRIFFQKHSEFSHHMKI